MFSVPVAKKKLGCFTVGLLCLLALYLLGKVSNWIGPATRSQGASERAAASYRVDASELYGEYKANEVAADAKYKGQTVVVSGTIQNIGKDILDSAYVVIGGRGFLDGVQCSFSKGDESDVARLSKGQLITVEGEVYGKLGNVLLKKCSLR